MVGRRYRVLFGLGQGGSANVYLALATGPAGFNKLVVLKALKKALSHDPEYRRMFLNEANLSARLNHTNIVQVNEAFEHDEVPYIVMEYLEGKALSEVRARTKSSFPVLLHLRAIAEALNGVHHAHELRDYDGKRLNVVHRDMTPHNVIITYDGGVKVVDFGIAKLDGSLVETQTGVIKGKLRYMPPEQIAGEGMDHRVDIYAAGIMLWEAVSGERMWNSLSEAAVMKRAIEGEIPRPSSVNPNVDPQLENVIMRALSTAPSERHATAHELAAEIEEYLAGHSHASSTRELGEFMKREFTSAREEMRSLIDEFMSRVDKGATDDGAPVILPQGETFTPRLNTMSGSQSGLVQSTASTTLTAARRPLVWTALLLPALPVLGYVVWKQVAGAESTHIEATASPTAQEAPKPTDIRLSITAFPAHAKIWLDGELLPSNPATRKVPRDDAEHVVRVEADGFQADERIVRFDKDADLVLTLSAESTPSSKPGPEPRSVRRPPGPRPAPLRADCNPPFTVVDGIKRYKPQCL
jgi:serine/threonine-protein kinase